MAEVEGKASVEFPILEEYSRIVFPKSIDVKWNFLYENLWRQAIVQFSKKFFDGEDRFLKGLLLQKGSGKLSMAYRDGEGQKIKEIKDVNSMDEVYLGKNSRIPDFKEYFRVSEEELEKYNGVSAIAKVKSGPNEVYGSGIFEKDAKGVFRLNYNDGKKNIKKPLGKRSLDNILVENSFRG